MMRTNFKSLYPKGDNQLNIRKDIRYGLIIIALFFGGFLLWSILTSIDAAAIAPGKIVVESKRQTIQHLEGGIITKIFVKDGTTVQKDDPLIELSSTHAKVTLDVIQGQLHELLAQKARLEAERDDLSKIDFPNRLSKNKQSPKISKLLKSQTRIFETQKKAFKSQLEILNYKITQLEQEINSFKAQQESVKKQIALIEEELKAMLFLSKKKLIEKPKILALKREHARLIGNQGEYLGQMAKARQKIAETKSQIITFTEEHNKNILHELRETSQKLAQLYEKEKSAKDILNRTMIYAPMSGVVVGLQKHTISGVISPGQPVLDIVPNNAKYVIEARISPLDIDVVHPGLKAKIQLTAFKQRNTPSIEGEVTVVSADILKDEQTGEQFYQVKIDNFQNSLAKIKTLKLYSGMPVQVMIITDNRSPLSYLLSPLKESINRSFRED